MSQRRRAIKSVWSTQQCLKKNLQLCWKTLISLAVTPKWRSSRHSTVAHQMPGSKLGRSGLKFEEESWGFVSRVNTRVTDIFIKWLQSRQLKETLGLWSRDISLSLLYFLEIYWPKHVQVGFCCFYNTSKKKGNTTHASHAKHTFRTCMY